MIRHLGLSLAEQIAQLDAPAPVGSIIFSSTAILSGLTLY